MMKSLYLSSRVGRLPLMTLLTAAAGLLLARPAAADGYRTERLVSDRYGFAHQYNANVNHPWGIAVGPTGPLWVVNNRTGVATALAAGQLPSRVVTIAQVTNTTLPATPTGLVFNDSSHFELAPGQPARFLAATEDGTIVGWDPDLDMGLAQVVVNNMDSAVYTGLAIHNHRLYACNFRGGRIDVFDRDFTPLGSITDTTLPERYAPFNIQNLGGTLVVTFAEQHRTKAEPVSGDGRGFVDTFEPGTGQFRRVISRGALDAPWGMALAPADFGRFSNSLLIGNFGNGVIHAFDPATGSFLGRVRTPGGDIIQIRGLRGLTFGNGFEGGSRNILYYTAGQHDGGHSHVGNVQAVR